ncbi:MAG: hypothetical protein NVSMB5_09170 [Candidatus Velthaea sp.]
MIRRLDRELSPLEKSRVVRSAAALSHEGARGSDLALAYSNGFVSVEISHAALDAFVALKGDVPLPVVRDPQNGDIRMYDARHKVRVVYDRGSNLREVTTRSPEGLYIRVNFPGGLAS